MGLIDRIRRQTCVHWSFEGVDEFGRRIFAAPVELSCRWEDVTERFVDNRGEESVSRSKVYLPSDIKVGDYLMLGTLDDLQPGEADDPDPTRYDDAFSVRQFSKIPDLRAKNFLRVATL